MELGARFVGIIYRTLLLSLPQSVSLSQEAAAELDLQISSLSDIELTSSHISKPSPTNKECHTLPKPASCTSCN